MNADGSVQPIGGVQAKIRGATKGSCKLVGVPVKNEKSVQDLLVPVSYTHLNSGRLRIEDGG